MHEESRESHIETGWWNQHELLGCWMFERQSMSWMGKKGKCSRGHDACIQDLMLFEESRRKGNFDESFQRLLLYSDHHTANQLLTEGSFQVP